MPELELLQRARGHGDAIAVASTSSTETVSYNQLLDRSADIASELLGHNPDLNEARVAYLVPAGSDYIGMQWGIWRAGGVAVPLSLSATNSELEYALTDSQASIVATTQELAAKTEPLCQQLRLRHFVIDETGKCESPTLPDVGPDRLAMILYTSGTTSKPKGVVTTHANVQAQITTLVDAWEWEADDCIPLFLPLHHIHGIINVMSCALWSGAKIEPFAHFDQEAILRRVAEGFYSVFMAVPTIYVKLIQALEGLPAGDRSKALNGFGQMRLMVSGSAALPATVHEQWTALTGQKLLERYGMTEIGMALSNKFHGLRKPGAVGQPLPDVEIRLAIDGDQIIDSEEEPGEIQVRGPSVFQEYWNRPEATAESFIDGWFRTGDIAVLEDGYYRIMGRQSVDIIKSGGYKLSALEIESVLLEHPMIAQCAVVGIGDETWGEAVAAAIVTADNGGLTLDELKTWCRDRLSHYKIPKHLRVVSELPRNAMGKIQKPAVKELF